MSPPPREEDLGAERAPESAPERATSRSTPSGSESRAADRPSPGAPHPRESRAKRRSKILCAQIGIAIVGLVLLEGLARAYFLVRGRAYDSVELTNEVRRLRYMSKAFVPVPYAQEGEAQPPVDPHAQVTLHPYLGYDLDFGCNFLDEEYERLRSGASKGEFQILIVGGSVAALFGQYEKRANTMCDRLRADPRFAGRTIRVLNFGRGAYKEPQQVNSVAYLFALGFKPDVVVAIDGFNEVALASENSHANWNPLYPSATQWTHLATWGSSDQSAVDRVSAIRSAQRSLEAWAESVIRWRLDRVCVLGELVLHRIYALQHRIAAESNEYTKHGLGQEDGLRKRGPKFEGGPEAAVKASVECWKSCSRSLTDMCRARGIPCVQFLQPTALDAGSKPLTQREKGYTTPGTPWAIGVEVGYPLLRAASTELRDLGVEFVDASLLFQSSTQDIYYDPCHYEDAGNALLAARVAEELLKRLPERL